MEREFKDEKAIQYLLGQLSEQEREQFEERYFTEESFFENFLAVKEELIDLYARDELPGHQLERFEAHFLASPSLRQRIEETKRVIAAVSQPVTDHKVESGSSIEQKSAGWWHSVVASLVPDSRILQFALGALALIALVLGGWWWQARSRSARIEAEHRQQTDNPIVQPTTLSNARVDSSPPHESAQSSPVDQEKKLPSPGPSVEQATEIPKPSNSPTPSSPQIPAASVATITLTPVLFRDSDNPPRLSIGPNASVARLILVLKNVGYKNYVAVVRTLEGSEVRSLHGLVARKSRSGRYITIDLPTVLLTRQDYLVTLNGVTHTGSVEEIGKYYLMIERSAP